ncbi:nucleotidyltransferase domain-containing protein [Pseudomonas oryzihabitans]|uniref:nucleotidyltransferase domain-containing protein n=1 Tax=Pseudomonas oryzihabitans TaxID=47885 RepID=UPI0028962715|nr:nucleotidyltransferase domain-containing protein [Pseudomonas oryzihabitans]MDT3719076.1 nucleotidyltransferase domain-containing protein [Pseudomonas oryzihabitans]
MRQADSGLDAEGFIRQVPRVSFQAEYRAVLTAVRSQLPTSMGSHLVALYVYGSVAEGCARPGHSDLDLTLILSDACPSAKVVELEHLRRALELKHPEVSKIDFDIGRRAEALAAGSRLSWGFWLKHHCRWMWGEDLARRFAPFKPEVAIARAVSGEVLPVLEGYLQTMAGCTLPAERLRLQREAARRLLRSLLVLRRPEEIDWPWTLEDHWARALRLHPEQGSALVFFYAEAQQLQAGAPEFGQRLAEFLSWFAQQPVSPEC